MKVDEKCTFCQLTVHERNVFPVKILELRKNRAVYYVKVSVSFAAVEKVWL